MVHAFQVDEEQSPPTAHSTPEEDTPIDHGFLFWGVGQFYPGEFSETLADAFMDYGIQFDLSCSEASSSSTDEAHAGRVAAIIDELDVFHASLENNNQLQSEEDHFDVAMAHEILSPATLRTQLESYFRYTDLYIPTIHRPTFDIENAPPVLLLALFLCGSLYTGDKNRDYQGLRNLAEEYAFIQLKLVMDRAAVGGATMTKEVADALRAAALIHNLQWVVQSASSRKRNRSVRLPALISAVRTLGYTRLRHAEQNPRTELDWRSFIELETCIR